MLNLVIIEDNLDLLDLLSENLTARGFATHGYATVADYEASGIVGDLFLLDLNLPGEDGLKFAARLKQARPEVGIVILSARAGSQTRTESYISGADTFLQKPCDLLEIYAALTSIARRLRFHSEQMRQSHTLTLSPTTLQISGKNGAVSLSLAETRLIAAMIKAPENRLTYTEIINLLDPTGTLSLATLEVRIARLHSKIKPLVNPGRLFRSIRKFGYQLTRPVELA